MKISIASDHAGFDLKNFLVEKLRLKGFDIHDHGAHELIINDDYPAYISKVALDVSKYEESIHEIEIDASYSLLKKDNKSLIQTQEKFLIHNVHGIHKEQQFGIVIGGSGQGEAILANKFPYVRAVVLYGGASVGGSEKLLEQITTLSREHNDANILSLGARFISHQEALKMVLLWLGVPFSEDTRHIRRIHEIEDIEKKY